MAIIKNPVTIVQTGGGVSKLPQVVDKSITSLSASDLQGATSIGGDVFYECLSLTSVEIPNTVTSIGVKSFYNCGDLATFSYESNSQLASIGDEAFSGCTSLASVSIPNSLTSLGDGVFTGCTSLIPTSGSTNIYLGNTDNPYLILARLGGSGSITIPSGTRFVLDYAGFMNDFVSGITFPNTVTTIGIGAFKACEDRLGRISFDSNSQLKTIKDSAFQDCYVLWDINLPEGLEYIGEYAFNCCDEELVDVTIPSTVTFIGSDAFGSCESLASVTVLATTPPTLGKRAFDDTDENLVIYVPANSVSAYKSATNWSSYASRIQAIT